MHLNRYIQEKKVTFTVTPEDRKNAGQILTQPIDNWRRGEIELAGGVIHLRFSRPIGAVLARAFKPSEHDEMRNNSDR